MRLYHGLLGVLNRRGVRVITGVVDFDHGFVRQMDFVNDARNGGHQIQIVFAFQAFLDNFKVQKPQKSAAEAEAQSPRGFGLKGERGVV